MIDCGRVTIGRNKSPLEPHYVIKIKDLMICFLACSECPLAVCPSYIVRYFLGNHVSRSGQLVPFLITEMCLS